VQRGYQVQRGGECCGGTGIQALGQAAENAQGAGAASLAAQLGAANANAPVRVDSDGGDGDVEQSNGVHSAAGAANLNATGQTGSQTQSGGGGIAVQALGQSASSVQTAIGLSAALQLGAANHNGPVAVGSTGGSGNVSQANAVASHAAALNDNLTVQSAAQDQSLGCGCHHGLAVQAAGQEATNDQAALAASLAAQAGGRTCGCDAHRTQRSKLRPTTRARSAGPRWWFM
jgi:hypothetical protein